MYCSRCGKRITEDMLYCPFCGSPVVIPEQPEENGPRSEPVRPANERRPVTEREEPAAEREARPSPRVQEPEPPEDIPEEEAPEDIPEAEAPPEDIPFEPLDFEETLRQARESEERRPKREEEERRPVQPEDVSLRGHAPDLSNVQSPQRGRDGRKKNTYAPRRQFNPNDIFMEGSEREEEEDEEEYYYEEEEPEGFFTRHIRGFIAFIMLIILLVCMGVWLFSGPGQRFLARADLAWYAAPYAQEAEAAFSRQEYVQSAIYFEKAFGKDPTRAEYAVSSAVAYVWAQNNVAAERMARRAIAVDPLQTEAYKVLLHIYPDPATRPADVTSLIREGYARTHDAELDI